MKINTLAEEIAAEAFFRLQEEVQEFIQLAPVIREKMRDEIRNAAIEVLKKFSRGDTITSK
jgi:hypothetical protein